MVEENFKINFLFLKAWDAFNIMELIQYNQKHGIYGTYSFKYQKNIGNMENIGKIGHTVQVDTLG